MPKGLIATVRFAERSRRPLEATEEAVRLLTGQPLSRSVLRAEYEVQRQGL